MPFKLKKAKLSPVDSLEHERLTTLINSMADAVIAVDPKVQVVLYNSAALNILDLNNLKPRTPLAKVLKPIDKNNQHINLTKLIEQAKIPLTNRDLRLAYQDGSLINLYLSIAPVRLSYGEEGDSGYVLLLRDITREKSLEEERDEFISVVSHELRTPIAIAEGNISNAELLFSKSSDDTDIKQALKEAHSQVLFLADMINDLSTLSRAERGKLNVSIEDINVTDLVNELINSYSQAAQAKHLTISHSVEPKAERLYSSRLYVREILQNFMTNALKYTDKGHISITAHFADRGVIFSVSDSGIGISKADQARVFDKFFRSEDYRTRQSSGTGLGLYVTMKLARLIHAEIRLTSELNQGSTFSVFVPNLKQAKPVA